MVWVEVEVALKNVSYECGVALGVACGVECVIKIDSNQKYYRFVSISVNKIDRNCVKSISIDKVYGIFTILVMNDFE